MTEPAAALPIALERVESARGQGDNVRLRLSGRWLGPGDPNAHEALLVVHTQGRRHRFPAHRGAPVAGDSAPPGSWRADFCIPSWAVPSRPGQAAVWIGDAVMAVGPPGKVRESATPASVAPAPRAPEEVAPGEPASADAPSGEARRSGPLTDLLYKETVTALHAELDRRSEEAAQLRGALAETRSELEVREARQASLEAAHRELRHELEELMAAVTRQRLEFNERIAAAESHRDRSREEAAMASAAQRDAESELERVRRQLVSLDERLGALGAAEQRRAQEATSLREQLAVSQISRDAAISEAGGLRAELERLGAELTVFREQLIAQGGDLGEAQRLLAGARALTEQLRGESTG